MKINRKMQASHKEIDKRLIARGLLPSKEVVEEELRRVQRRSNQSAREFVGK